MDVAVRYKRGQRRQHSVARPSLLGSGLLERARSTSLGLLGVTAAVGLAMVALALNQNWPLVAGVPIPRLPPLHQGVGEATIATSLRARAHPSQPTPHELRQAGEAPRNGNGGPEPVVSPGGVPAASAELVVAPSAPAPPHGGHAGGNAPDQAQQPSDAQQKAPKPVAVSPPQPETPPTSQSAPEPQAPPTATVSDASDGESDTPSGSRGNGHAYGRDDDHDWGHDRDWDDDHEWDDHDSDDDWDHDDDWDRGSRHWDDD